MQDSDLSGSNQNRPKNSSTFKTMSILSFVGNGIWAFLFLLLFIGCVVNGAALMKSVSLDSFFEGAIMFFAVISALIIAACLVAIVGVVKMKNGKRRGFFLYAIANGLWSLLLFYAGTGDGGTIFWIGGIISLLFIGFYMLRLHKLH